MNLHNVVRGPIGSVNAHETVKLYTCTGTANVKGQVVTTYTVSTLRAQVQAPSASDLEQNDRLAAAKHRKKIYLDAPAGTINRFSQSAGDIIKRADGSYWLIVSTGDDFSNEGWLYVLAILQVEPPSGTIIDPDDTEEEAETIE